LGSQNRLLVHVIISGKNVWILEIKERGLCEKSFNCHFSFQFSLENVF
jgi:hypothetical protein